VQLLTIPGNAPAGSTFTLSFEGFTTGALAFNAPVTGANSVQSALDTLLANFGLSAGTAQVSGSVGDYSITFTGAWSNAYLPQMTVPGTGFVAGSSPTITTVQYGVGNAVQQLTLGGTSGGTFTLSYNGVAASSALTFTTGSAPSAAQVQTN